MKDEEINKNVEVIIVPGETGKTCGDAECRKIQRVVQDNLLAKRKQPYHKVQVEVEVGSNGNPKALVASMLRADTYTADIVKVNVDAEYNVRSVEPPPEDV